MFVDEREQRYRAVFDSCYAPLHAFARRRMAPADADDLVAEVLTTAWRRLDDIPRQAALPWLYGVAHRTLANQRRSGRRQQRLIRRISDHRPAAAATSTEPPEVLDALGRLRADDQEILRLAAWEELTASEIAVVLECTPNAAALRLSRARKRLRDQLAAPATAAASQPRRVPHA